MEEYRIEEMLMKEQKQIFDYQTFANVVKDKDNMIKKDGKLIEA